MDDSVKLEQPRQRTRMATFMGRTVVGLRWDRGAFVIDFDGPNEKSLVIEDTERLYDENGNRFEFPA